MEGVRPAGSDVKSARAVKNGAADDEQVDADGADGAFEVTVYNQFVPAELTASAWSAPRCPTMAWRDSGSGERLATIYFLSSRGVGLRIAHRAASGRTTSAASLRSSHHFFVVAK